MARAVLYSLVAVCFVGAQCSLALPRLTAVANSTTQDEQNEEFDTFVSAIASYLTNKTVTIPDLSLASGILTATGGEVTGLTTLERVGNATVNTTSTTITVNGSITFSSLKLVFDELSIKFSILPTIGGSSATVSITENQIDVSLDINVDTSGNSCGLTINKLELSELSGFEISFGNFSIINWLIAKFAPYYLNTLASSLISQVGNSALTLAQTLLGNINFCS